MYFYKYEKWIHVYKQYIIIHTTWNVKSAYVEIKISLNECFESVIVSSWYLMHKLMSASWTLLYTLYAYMCVNTWSNNRIW